MQIYLQKQAYPHHKQPSPLRSSSNPEAATSSDTCSTCTSSPILTHNHSQCTQPCTLLGLIHQDRNPHMSPNMRPRSPQSQEQADGSPKACSSQTQLSQKHSWCGKQASQNHPLEQVPIVQTPQVIKEETTGPLDASFPLHQNSSPAITSVTSLTSITSLVSLPCTGQKSLWRFEASSQVCTNEESNTNVQHTFKPRSHLVVLRWIMLWLPFIWFTEVLYNYGSYSHINSHTHRHMYKNEDWEKDGRHILWVCVWVESGGSYVFNHFYVCFLNSAGVLRERRHGDTFSMTDRPPEDFCLSPQAPSDRLSIDLLHKRSEMMNNHDSASIFRLNVPYIWYMTIIIINC